MDANRPRSPLWATVNVTGRCNLSCSYCFFQPRKHEHMPLPSFRKVARMLREQDVFFLTLSGGEPFVHPGIVEILDVAHRQFEYVTVLSNGSVIFEDHLACVREIVGAKGAFPIQVSLDAVDPETNDLTRGRGRKVKDNLEALRDAGASITIAIVVTSQNIDHVVRTIVESRHLTRHFHVMPFKPVPFLDEADDYLGVDPREMNALWDRLGRLREEHGLLINLPADECQGGSFAATGAPCVAGFTQLVIDPDLDVRACSRCTHAVVGNLDEHSLDSVWNGPELAHVYQRDVPYCRVPSEWTATIRDPGFATGKRGA